MKKIHLIGIGGSGLSAIARLLLESGYKVSGSDKVASPRTAELVQSGATVYNGHHGDQVDKADLIIQSSAIPADNPELVEAARRGIPVQKRSEFLGGFLKDKTTIAVAGTHGKTTTTAMIAWLLTAMRIDPGYLIGGISKNLGNNAHAGQSDYFVIEADEYDRMFLGLSPDLAVITTIEHDHPDLFPTQEAYLEVFGQFALCIHSDGKLLIDQSTLPILADRLSPGIEVVTFGLGVSSNYRAENLNIQPNGCYQFDLRCADPNKVHAVIPLQIPGKHNVMNALAALSVVDLLGLSITEAAMHLHTFSGVERRFEIKAEIGGVIFIDDYAHHPTEIRSTLQATRDRFPGYRIIAVWQPHTFSRSKLLFSEFTNAFQNADKVFVTEVYAAREEDPAFSAVRFLQEMQHEDCEFVPDMRELIRHLEKELRHNDVLIVLSAGNAVSINEQLVSRFQAHQSMTSDLNHQQVSPEKKGR
jgi:UDP-N-acetylmuramate--alanine ligase